VGGNQGASVGSDEGAARFEGGWGKEVADGGDPGPGAVVESLVKARKVVVGETVLRCYSSVAGFWMAAVQISELHKPLFLLDSWYPAPVGVSLLVPCYVTGG